MAACMFIIVIAAFICGYSLGLEDRFAMDSKFPKLRKRYNNIGRGKSEEDL
jgi:hypothetical protein